jgi:glycosyltransferase involved in cell wall biosynthesis
VTAASVREESLGDRRLRVLALLPYPPEAANSRYRLLQFLPALAAAGIDVSIRPFVDSRTFRVLYDRRARARIALGLVNAAVRRMGDVARARRADVLLVLRGAMIAGPPVVEALATRLGRCPLVLDLDDPTWIPQESLPHGRLATALKPPSKTDSLIDRASLVTCGSRSIADHVRSRGRTTVLVGPAVDTDVFRPQPRPSGAHLPVVGWIGSHSTYPYLASILPALRAVSRDHPFRLLVVGAGQAPPPLPGIEVDWRDYSQARETAQFASLDIGLYPLPLADEWAAGKAGIKAVHYMASGVAYIASPVGATADIGLPGETHLLAASLSDWEASLRTLLADPARRAEMGAAGRRHALAHHTADAAGAVLARALLAAASEAHDYARKSRLPV